MSKRTNWKDIVELIGIVAIVASLLAVVFELRQTTQEIRFSTLDSTLGHYNEWRAKIIENEDVAEIWRIGLSGEELSPNQELRFRHLLAELMYANQAAYFRLQEASYSDDQADTNRNTIARLMQNDVVLDRWRENRFGSSYTEDFSEYVDSILVEE